jgi:hypothetical protein
LAVELEQELAVVLEQGLAVVLALKTNYKNWIPPDLSIIGTRDPVI